MSCLHVPCSICVTTYWIAHSDCPNNGCAMMDNNHTMECVQCSDKRLVFCKKERPCQYVKNVTSAFRELIQEDNLNDCEHNCCTKTKCVGWSFTANGCYHYNSTLDTTTEGTIANTKQPLNIIEHYVRNTTTTGEPEAYTNFEICEGIEESSYLSEMSTQTPYFSSSVESTAEMTSMLTYSSSYETGISMYRFSHKTARSHK
ncbi:Hypothetical predicted protein [Octopus vulgaris]|uniref:Apple domain-containing protein n=1 Tax=Octopus vulgaris TaxID=6645 RepID=A0AA36FM04_OCTVU|nr:Hypothetical predicted protein [Octopus vulgaris]